VVVRSILSGSSQNSRAAERSCKAVRSDSRNPFNPINPDETSDSVASPSGSQKVLDSRPRDAIEIIQTGEDVARFRSVGRTEDAGSMELVDYPRGATIAHLEASLQQRGRSLLVLYHHLAASRNSLSRSASS